MNIDIGELVNNVSKVTLKGGIFAKTCSVLIIVAISMLGISFFAKNIWISGISIFLIFFLTLVILWRLINFANKNPQAAILEGAQFLVHEQIQLAAKGIPSLPNTIQYLKEDKPIELKDNIEAESNKPDEIGEKGKEENNG